MVSLDPKKIFFDDQDILDLDIKEVYNNFIQEIDNYRSHFNAINGTLDVIINQEQIDSLISKTDLGTSTVQESRCSAFFRLLGLPIIHRESGDLYNSGFDRDLNLDTDKIKKNFTIAGKILKSDSKRILNFRETRPSQILNVFSKKDINSTAMALATRFPRQFNYFEKQTLSSSILQSQMYSVLERNSVLSLLDEDGNKPTINLANNNYCLNQHIIHPLIVDPRIDLTVIPSTKRICAPFLLDKSKTQLRPNVYLQRPYLEKVISIRCNISNKSESAGDYVNLITELINSDDSIKDSGLLEDIRKFKDDSAKFELLILAKLFKLLRATTLNLFISVKELENITRSINFYPIPDKRGPEFAGSLREVTAATLTSDSLIEIDIRDSIRKKVLDEINFNLGLKDSASIGNFAFSGTNDIIFGQFTNVSKFYDKQIKDLTSEREHQGNFGNQYLSNIEIITGEISGLGLIDIICINSAFWLIEKKFLINMLDQNAINRLSKFKELQSKEVADRVAGVSSAIVPGDLVLKEFEKKVGEMYNLAQKFYDDCSLTHNS